MGQGSWVRLRGFLLWVTVAEICLIGGGGWLWQNEQRRGAWDAFELKREEMKELAKEAGQRVSALWKSGHPENLTVAEVERELNEGEPLLLREDGDRQTAIWKDPASGGTFEVSFRDGRWTGIGSSWGYDELEALVPQASDFDPATEAIRSRIAGWNSGWGC